ncbi:MAG: 30S ribosomal protein S20 [Rhodobacterales bacterium 12-64-8]|nr:MAG: 30S ribosomal protein S20 [Rhodobacterales bacterium 12-64-8]OYX44959.1 MAG: 30S ribosomal protein S20 [Alphaproteobacteria bacterium 32-64-14]
MANTKSAKKMVRKIAARTEVNKSRKSRIRTFTRKVEEAISSGDKKAAIAALKAAEPEIMRGVTVGVTHKNTASRKVSRLAARVKGLTA